MPVNAHIKQGVPVKRSKFRRSIDEFLGQKELQMMVLPGIIFLIIFAYVPMYGLIMAFQDYQIGEMIGFSKWVGLKNFIEFFKEPAVYNIFRNTISVSMLRMLIGFPAPIIFAILINEVKNKYFKSTIQTVSYLPHFISWVVVSGMVIEFLSPDGGMLNGILTNLGLIKEPILFLGEKKYFWSILVLSDVWKEIGWSAIIYLAAITSIDPEQYEAAGLDGAGRLRMIWNITLPSIRPTIVILLILSVGSILNAGFEQIILLGNSSVSEVSEVIDTYVLRMGIRQLRFSYASAIGFFKSAVAIILLFTANKISHKVSDTSLW